MTTAPKREEVVDAFRALVHKGVQNPFAVLYTEEDDASKKLTELYDAWTQRAHSERSIDEQVTDELLDNTIFYDAGFTDPDLLDEMAGDWLANTLAEAEGTHRRDLAQRVQAKINEIQEKIQEQDPDYEITDFSIPATDWNPPREGGPEAFYPDYAYWKGPGNVDMDDAIKEYLHLHPTGDSASVRAGFEKAARDYKETA